MSKMEEKNLCDGDDDLEMRIAKAAQKIKKMVKAIDPSIAKNHEELINNIGWQYVMLDDLRRQVIQYGAVEKYQNGATQSGTKDSSYLRAYNNLSKTNVACIRLLGDIIKQSMDSNKTEETNELMSFLKKGKK